jgi:hypothetical protein
MLTGDEFGLISYTPCNEGSGVYMYDYAPARALNAWYSSFGATWSDSVPSGIGAVEFVNSLYQGAFNRSPQQAELDADSSQLAQRTVSGKGICMEYLTSTAFLNRQLNDTDYINAIYIAALGRSPDAGGLSFSLSYLSSGKSRNQLLLTILDSPEFIERCNIATIQHWTQIGAEQYTYMLYYQVLNQAPTRTELNTMAIPLRVGTYSARPAALAKLTSPAFVNLSLTNAQFIQVLYRALLDREPETWEIDYWTSRISAGDSRSTVMDNFFYSQEFINRCVSLDIIPYGVGG